MTTTTRKVQQLLCGSVGILALAGTMPQAAFAQAADEDQAAENDGAALDVIVVTARKREENVQSTPISVSAFGAKALEERNVQTSADITNFVPNVQFDSTASESGGGATSQISIRGIGQTDYVLTVEPAVGIYLDGVYVGKSIGSLLDAVDVARLEVLRGPQGTLFGKNTIGGAVQLVSQRPTDYLDGYLEATAGSFSRVTLKGAVSGPLSDGVRARVSGYYDDRGGYVDRVTADGTPTGEHQGDMNRLGGRLALEFDITPDFMATLALDATRIREQSPGQILLFADEAAPFAGLYNLGVPADACTTGADRLTNTDCYNSQWERPLDSYESTNSGDNWSDTDVMGASLSLEWNLGAVTLKSISAWRDVEVDVSQELTGAPPYHNYIGQMIETEQFSQEFQLLGDAIDGRLNYVAGLYYLHEKGEQVFPVNLTLIQFISGGAIKNDSYAAFGQATFDITDQFSITGGLRYTDETRRFNPAVQEIAGYDAQTTTAGFTNFIDGAFGPPGTPLFPAGWYSRSESSTTPMLSANYKFTPDVMAYATWSKGFKGGGFTMRYFPPVIPDANTDPNDIVSYAGPEHATSYELGLKTELFDRKARFNVATFWTDYNDIQVTYNIDPDGPGPIGAFVPVLANAASAEIKGIEAELSAVLSKALRIDGSLGYIDAEYTSFGEQAIANFPGIESFEIANTPEWTANLGATATFFDNDSGKASARVDYAYRSGQFKEFSNHPSLYQEGYSLLNASVSYVLPSERLELTAGVTNITDEAYISSGVFNGGIGYSQAVVSRPREWFLRLRHSL